MKRIPGVLFGLMIVISGFMLASCTTWKPVVLPSGQQGFTVDCSGTNLTWSHCFQKAGRACPQGYDVAERLDKHGGKVAAGDLYGLLGGSVVDRSMLIHCKDGATPVVAPANQPPVDRAETFPAGDGAAMRETGQPPSVGVI